ncbi:MAG TPA: AmmeMemoRadiSam system protein B, partial [Spirochaetia bacterium]|nr:AmmeMemoRadiSam system protein B [Spirochaetia bacterium]
MKVRKRNLPDGWYPASAAETTRMIESLYARIEPRKSNVIAGIVPHAGWAFSGAAALEVFLSVLGPIDTCVV